MEWLSVAVFAGVVGLLVGLMLGGIARTRMPGGQGAHSPQRHGAPDPTEASSEIPDAGGEQVLAVLGYIAIVVDSNDAVVMHGHGAVPLGLVRDSDLVHAALREVVRGVRRDGVIREL